MLNTITTENKQTPEIHINLCRMRKYTPPPKKKGEQKFKNTCTCLQIYRNWFNSNILFCSKRTEKDKETIFKGIYVFSGKNCQYTRFMLYVETTRCLTSFSNRTHVQFPHCASFVFIISGFFKDKHSVFVRSTQVYYVLRMCDA